MRIIRKASFALSILGFAGFCFGASLEFKLNKGGLTSLTYKSSTDSTEITNSGLGMIGSPTYFLFKKTDGSTSIDSLKSPTSSLDTANQTVVLSKVNARAKVMCKYVKVADTTIEFRIVIQNLSSDTLISAEIPLVCLISPDNAQILNLPCDEADCYSDGKIYLTVPHYYYYPLTSEPTSPYEKGPGVTMIGLGNTCCVTLCNMNDFKKLIYWKLGTYSYNNNSPKITVMAGRQINAQAASQWRPVPLDCKNGTKLPAAIVDDNFRVRPNSFSDTLVYQLRFTSPGLTNAKFAESAKDIFMRYGGEYPFKWTPSRADRRPVMHANLGYLWEGLPLATGFGDIQYIADTAALKEFHKRAMGLVKAQIGKMKEGKMRGIIYWGFEGFNGLKAPIDDTVVNGRKYVGLGGSYPTGNLLYFGDPDMVDTISPEWGYKLNPGGMCLADSFFGEIKKANLEPGLYVQPTKLMRVGKYWKEMGDCDGYPTEEELFQDVKYAHERWGVTLFHLDDNIYHHLPDDNYRRGGWVISGNRVGKRIMEAFPDVSLDNETTTANWFQWGADFANGPAYPFINYIWPDAYSRFYPNFHAQKIPVEYISGILSHGDVMFHGEYDYLDSLKKILTIVGNTWSRPTATITSPDSGASLPTIFTIEATAAADSPFTITRVEFLSAGIELGEDATPPYEFEWKNALPGKHSLYARAVSSNTKVTKRACSPPVCITVNPSVSINRDLQFINPALKNNSGPMSVSIYSLNGRLVRKIDFKDPAHFVTAKAIKGLSSGIYVLKAKHANGTIVKRKIEAVW